MSDESDQSSRSDYDGLHRPPGGYTSSRETPFLQQHHLQLLSSHVKYLPNAYLSLDCSRPTLLFFCIGGLDLMNQLNVVSKETKKAIRKLLYMLQLGQRQGVAPECYGFRGNFYSYRERQTGQEIVSDFESAHIAQTYSALCCLLILGDDLRSVDREAILKGVGNCQQRDGSFSAFSDQSESDMRFVFCALAICYILNNFDDVDTKAICDFIESSINYDGGIGQGPNFESHGGSTYCAVASLFLMGRLWDGSVLTPAKMTKLKRWLVLRQNEGFHGRANKPDDTCYAFWIGATLWMLNAHTLVDAESLRGFLMSAQDQAYGGFAKYPDVTPDILHTYFSIAALSIYQNADLSPVYPPLNLPMRAYHHLCRINSFQVYSPERGEIP